MPVIELKTDAQYIQEVNNQGAKLVVIDFSASWCGPCKRIAPVFEELSRRYPSAVFFKVDVDQCPDAAASQNVTAMPTFVLMQNKTKLARIQGADQGELEAKIKQYHGTSGAGDCGVPGYTNLSVFLFKTRCEAMNVARANSLTAFLENASRYLESDCDEQIIISLEFTQAVRVHSIKIKGPVENGPKTVKLFINQPSTLDFDSASRNIPTQEIKFTPEDLEGKVVNLRYVKFQNVMNLQLFVADNQSGTEVTRIDELILIGTPVATTNMSEFKRVAGKAGEVH